jgi:P27 family predicted phage terminase small subunit
MGRIAKATGSKRSRPIQTIGEIPDPPSWLKGKGRQEWDRVKDILKSRNLLSGEDWAMLANYCGAVSLIESAWAEVEKSGLMVQSPNGYDLPNPAVTLARQQMELMVKISARLGLSPADRQAMRLDPSPAVEGDPVVLKFFGKPQSN